MKKIILFVCVCLVSHVGYSQNLSSQLDSLSYAIGVNIGQSFKSQGIEPNTIIVQQAISDVLTGNALLFNEEASNAYIGEFFQQKHMKEAEASKKVGDDFLEKNKATEGLIITESGLQYLVLTPAEGPKPTTTDKVKVHYHGTTIAGEVFDSSVERGTPAEFGLSQVIKGWTEGLQLMSVGSKYKFFVPSDLAYGTQGPPKIGPNAVLIFEVELLEIL